jgi:hypothetical protein
MPFIHCPDPAPCQLLTTELALDTSLTITLPILSIWTRTKSTIQSIPLTEPTGVAGKGP